MAASDSRKAAVVLGALPRDLAQQLLANLTPAEAAAISGQLASLGAVEQSEQSTACAEFAAAARSQHAPVAEAGRKYFVHAAHAPRGPARLRRLAHVGQRGLTALLADEQPQTVALVLACLPATTAASVLASLPGERQAEVVKRVATLADTSGAIMDDIAAALEERLSASAVVDWEAADGVARATEILQALDRLTQDAILDSLASAPQLSAAVRTRLKSLERQTAGQQASR